jgi:multisubunit Na+/H+ antiporter MnhG subunit
MLSFLPGPILALIAILLYAFFSITLACGFLLAMFIWLITPVPAWRKAIYSTLFKVPSA